MTNHNGQITGVANSVNDRFPVKVCEAQHLSGGGGGGVAIIIIGVILVGHAHAEEPIYSQNAAKSSLASRQQIPDWNLE